MKFLVTGQNKENGARMSLEFEAESKAAAERKALGSGMTVNRVEDVTDGYAPKAHESWSGRNRSRRPSRALRLMVLVAIVAVLYLYRARIHAVFVH